MSYFVGYGLSYKKKFNYKLIKKRWKCSKRLIEPTKTPENPPTSSDNEYRFDEHIPPIEENPTMLDLISGDAFEFSHKSLL